MLDKMPVRKQDAYRALELLEEYYNRLDSPEDKPLKNAIDRVIKVFKSRLFQALLDIQEFYESILLDEQSGHAAKIQATLQLAEEWEKQPMLKRDTQNGRSTREPTTTTNDSPAVDTLVTENPVNYPTDKSTATISRTTTPKENQRLPTPTPFSRIGDPPTESANRSTTPGLNPPIDITQFNYDDHWKEFDMELRREPNVGLGFSVAGGSDTPCINNSSAVVITRITEGGLAHQDGQLKLHDIILEVNGEDFRNIKHQPAVDKLKTAGNHVTLKIRRLAPPHIEEIKLEKPPNEHLGFSIAGGITHEHVKGDHGIFITNIIPGGIADKNGNLLVGDRLLYVQSVANGYDLEFIEHKHAVESIRQACVEGSKINLMVGHPTNPAAFAQKPAVIGNKTNGYRSPSQDEQGEPSGERQVVLRRGSTGFGFSIVHDENQPGIFISFIQSDGPAAKSGQLRRGDQILSVNDKDLRTASHEDAATVLKSCGETATLTVINRTKDFARVDDRRQNDRGRQMSREITGSTGSLKTSTKREFYVRAEFDYDPARDPSLPSGPGLKFHVGDILLVTNSADDNWWQAKHVTDSQDKEELGIIPSKSRVEKKDRAKQKRVNFNQQGSSSRSSTLDRDKKKNKKKLGLFNKSGEKKDTQSGEDSENEPDNSEPVPSYELVVQHQIDYERPVIIFGPFKELINDQLLNDEPERFANCVPHTSRQKRDNEVDGREYYFISTREQMERDIKNYLFIEAGEYGGNLYGTSVNAVRDVAKSSKHCILDVSGHAIRRLINAGLYPIVIYVKPRDVKWILDNMGEEPNDERAHQMFDKATKIEQQFGDHLTVTIEEETLAEVYNRVCEVIEREESVRYAWIPSKEKI